jgi:peptidoglycan-associated lipoprotein
MRRSPRVALFAIAVALLMLALIVGCSSRRKTSGEVPEPVPPPPSSTETPTSEDTSPPPSSSTSDDVGSTADYQDAFFDYDDASLREDAKGALEVNGKILQSRTNLNVVIEGHCDERGSVEYNLALGEQRARAAKSYLVSYGINAGRMTTISYGKERPFDPGHSEEAWAKNRRAHFTNK